MRRLTFGLLLLAALAVACSAQKAPDDVVITLERTTCLGTCPAYKLTIRGDGSVVYEGHKFVRGEGIRQRQVDKTAIATLLQAFAEADYFGLENGYAEIKNPDGTVSIVTDLPTTYTSLTLLGRAQEDNGLCWRTETTHRTREQDRRDSGLKALGCNRRC